MMMLAYADDNSDVPNISSGSLSTGIEYTVLICCYRRFLQGVWKSYVLYNRCKSCDWKANNSLVLPLLYSESCWIPSRGMNPRGYTMDASYNGSPETRFSVDWSTCFMDTPVDLYYACGWKPIKICVKRVPYGTADGIVMAWEQGMMVD